MARGGTVAAYGAAILAFGYAAVSLYWSAGGQGLLALDLVRPWGRVLPRIWLLIVAGAASAVLVVYGALNVLAGVLVLTDVYHPSGPVDRTALRWHAGVWDLWFLVWGVLLAVATASYGRLSRDRSGIRRARSR